jgi:hypothetical protein
VKQDKVNLEPKVTTTDEKILCVEHKAFNCGCEERWHRADQLNPLPKKTVIDRYEEDREILAGLLREWVEHEEDVNYGPEEHTERSQSLLMRSRGWIKLLETGKRVKKIIEQAQVFRELGAPSHVIDTILSYARQEEEKAA